MRNLIIVALLLISTIARADVVLRGGGSSNQATVNANGALIVNEGPSVRATYTAIATGLVTTALYNLSIEAEAGRGFRVSKVCVGVSQATAAALVTVTINRRTTVSSGGVVVAAEATGAEAVSKLDPSDANWSGVVRRTGTLGTIGPLVDGWGFTVGEIGAGTADSPSQAAFCQLYGHNGEKLPRVLAGVANGLSVNVSAPGAGGLASGSISVTFIAE